MEGVNTLEKTLTYFFFKDKIEKKITLIVNKFNTTTSHFINIHNFLNEVLYLRTNVVYNLKIFIVKNQPTFYVLIFLFIY
jgi:hypothetical protein